MSISEAAQPFIAPQISTPAANKSSSQNRTRPWIFALSGVAVVVVLGVSANKHRLWKGGCEAECHPKTLLKFHNTSAGFSPQNSTDDFDVITNELATNWPKESTVKTFKRQAVASDVAVCSTIGNDILEVNGTAADAVIAAVLCMGVVHPHSSGLGGGSTIIYYDADNKTAVTIDGRETAPEAATENMFIDVDNKTVSSLFGWHAIGVPGELAALWELHKRYGRLPWKDLFQPAIALAKMGVPVTWFFGKVLAFNKKVLLNEYADETMWDLILNRTTNNTFVEGEVIRMEVLAETLKTISEDPLGTHEFYHGSLAKKMTDDIQNGGGIVTMRDLAHYTVRVREPIKTVLRDNSTLYGPGLPSGNAVFHRALNILEGYCNTTKQWSDLTVEERTLFYHRFAEALKFGYARRGELGDDQYVLGTEEIIKDFLSEQVAESERQKIDDNQTFNDTKHYGSTIQAPENQQGTAHVSVLDRFGNGVSLSTSVNGIFGSYRISKSTGVMFNNHMDDFTTDPKKPNLFGVPPSVANKIEPGKRPQSSMSPLVILDPEGHIRLLAGGTGGTRIITGLFNVLARVLCFNQDLKSAMDAPRLHHQMTPLQLEYEKRFEKEQVALLTAKGHVMKENGGPQQYPWSAVEVILVNKTTGSIQAVCDGRKGGLPDGV